MTTPLDARYAKAVLCGHIECYNYHPSQNCDHPQKIRLSVEGLEWQVGEVSTALRRLTVAPQKTKDSTGEVTVPLTWAVVTQLSGLMQDYGCGWRPDPGLNKWIEREFLRRHSEYSSPSDLAFDAGRLSWTPMPHQLAGAYVGGLNKRFFFCDDMRPQPVDTPILTPQGWTTMGELVPGSEVYAQDGSVTRVHEVKFFGRQPVYRVTMNDRTSTLATADHRWRVFTANQRVRPNTRLGREGVFMTTQQLIDQGVRDAAGNRKWFLPQQPILEIQEPSLLDLDPYAYGALLGDGHLAPGRASLCCPDEDIHGRVIGGAFALSTTSITREEECLTTTFHRDGALLTVLGELDALHGAAGKFVDPAYLLADGRARLSLLRGLLDTDGTVTREHAVEFCSASSRLAQDVAFLGRSLGAVVTESEPQPAYCNGERKQDKYRVHLRFPADGPSPFWCERKASAWATAVGGQKRRNPPRSITAIEPAGEAEVCCIRIEHDSHVYLTDTTLIPTGNTGKTRTALLTLAELEARGENPFPAFVVAPASVVDPWLEELEAAFPAWPAVAYRGPKRKLLSTRYRVYVMSWDVFRTDMKHEHDLPPLLKFLMPQTVVYDEAHGLCVTHSSSVITPSGSKSISEVRKGDFVLGVDHATGRAAWTRVRRVGRSPLRPTVRLGNLELTPDHPVWVADSSSGEVPQLASDEGLPEFGPEPLQRATSADNQGNRYKSEQEAWVSHANGRERGAYYPAGAVAKATWRGVHPRVLSKPGSAETGLPDVLQSGPGLPEAEARGGAGRELTPLEAMANTGQQKGRDVAVTWLDSTEILEYGSPEQSLWNLETDTGNYVAAGVLVHNCNTKTKQSTAAKQIARVTPYVFPMSGTPITRDVGGFWTAMNVLDIRSFPDEDKYKDTYTDRFHGDYADVIDGISKAKAEEFHLVLKGSMRRVAKSDVNPDLLPPCYTTRAVDIPPAYRAAYDEMEQDMIAHMPDGEEPLEVMTTLAQLQRLTQLASSSCDVEVRLEIDENEKSPTFGEEVPRYHVTMQEPSWKIDELMAVMSENEGTGNPLIAFSPHTQLVKMAGARAESLGYKVGYIVGGQSSKQRTAIRLAYQGGELDLLCANVTAGGVGLTLNRGDTCVFLERPWAYWQAHQAEARVDDVINAKQVHVIDIVARNTVESRVRQALKDKARQLSELVRDPRIVTELLGGQPIHVK
jgi:helicase-like protein/SNF2 domain-containing protein/LAGLIDADG DNA endonuclease family protein